MATVSVLVNVYNGEDFLSLSIESIFSQTFSDFELVIVNDGSTDGTAQILDSIDDSRLRVVVNERNRGIPFSRNVAIDAASGKYIAFLSHDDIALPERLARQVQYLDENPAIDLIGSAVEVIDGKGKVQKTIQMPESAVAIRWLGLMECPMRQSSLMGRSEMVKRHRYDEHFQSYSDWDFIMRVARDSEVQNLPEVLVQYRRHTTNTSSVHRARLDHMGIDIACREIRKELPDFSITPEEVAEMRQVAAGAAGKKSLALTRRALERYLDLSEAFRAKYPDYNPATLPPTVAG